MESVLYYLYIFIVIGVFIFLTCLMFQFLFSIICFVVLLVHFFVCNCILFELYLEQKLVSVEFNFLLTGISHYSRRTQIHYQALCWLHLFRPQERIFPTHPSLLHNLCPLNITMRLLQSVVPPCPCQRCPFYLIFFIFLNQFCF